MVCIYVLIDPRDGRIRYVGASVNPKARLVAHKNEKADTPKTRWIADLLANGLSPEIVEIEWVSPDQWECSESWWIEAIQSEGCELTNSTSGGHGLKDTTPEVKGKLSVIQGNRMADEGYRSKIFTETRSEKISGSLKGRAKYPEHVAKLPQNQKGYKHREEVAHRLREVLQAYGYRHPKGKPMHENAREALRVANIGNQYTKGRVQPRQERLERSLSEQLKPKTEQHRGNISNAMKRMWASRQLDGSPSRRSPVPMAWPPLEELEAKLRTMTQKELALELCVKPSTLGAYLWRKRSQSRKDV